MIDVCICTHNPPPNRLALVIQSLAQQSLAPDQYQVWLIDNASEPPLTEDCFAPLQTRGVSAHLVKEPQLGVINARYRAMTLTNNELLVFVDDDNELSQTYLEQALDIAQKHPEIGCFGGRLLLPPGVDVAPWQQPFLPFLAIQDKGDQAITKVADYWGEWEPPGAGVVLRRSVLEECQRIFQKSNHVTQIGRRGKRGLMSGSDTVITRCAFNVNLACSYQPSLSLIHHIDYERRLKLGYLLRLFYGYGQTYVAMEAIFDNLLGVAPLSTALDKLLIKLRSPVEYWQFKLALLTLEFSILQTRGVYLDKLTWQLWRWKVFQSDSPPKKIKKAPPQEVRTIQRVPFSQRFNFLNQLKSKYRKQWEFFRQLAISIKLIK